MPCSGSETWYRRFSTLAIAWHLQRLKARINSDVGEGGGVMKNPEHVCFLGEDDQNGYTGPRMLKKSNNQLQTSIMVIGCYTLVQRN
jgi:hypothetical protein